MMRTWGVSFFALVALVGLGSCLETDSSGGSPTPEGLVNQQCSLAVNCSCEGGNQFESVEQCTNSVLPSYDNEKEAAEQAGLEYDEDCATRQFEFMDEIGCGYFTDELLSELTCALNCSLYHGYVGPGEACVQYGSRSTDCAQGLECVGGVCADNCNNWRLAEGATCYDAADQPTGTCVTGTFCDIGDTNKCVALPGQGDPCPAGACEEDLWCNNYDEPEPFCDVMVGINRECPTDAACESGYCIGGTCAPLPNSGEPCSGECAGDLFCSSGTCSIKQQEGQACQGSSLPCAEGLACVGDVCMRAQPWVCPGGW